MTSFYFPFALAVGGMLFYHLAQKSIPKGMNPFHATIIAYAVGIVLCFVCALAYPGKRSLIESVKDSNWAVFVLGAAAASIELGFLLAYRAGWKLGVAGGRDQRRGYRHANPHRDYRLQRPFVRA
jgi:uncharacterized membrane protein YdcZ (DUF606 family)